MPQQDIIKLVNQYAGIDVRVEVILQQYELFRLELIDVDYRLNQNLLQLDNPITEKRLPSVNMIVQNLAYRILLINHKTNIHLEKIAQESLKNL